MIIRLSAEELSVRRAADHGRVIRAVLKRGRVKRNAGFFRARLHRLPQCAVSGDAAGKREFSPRLSGLCLRRTDGFVRKNIHNRLLKRCGKIGAADGFSGPFGVMQPVDHRGLDTGKAEIEPLALVKGGTEPVPLRVALQRELFEVRSAG